MCGISGIISTQKFDAKRVAASLERIKHRGPDDSLIFDERFFSLPFSSENTKKRFPKLQENQQSCACFGFNRLAIVDLSDNAMQPFYDRESNTVFMLNGEIYNYAELKRRFLSDVDFVSYSDSEVAFRLYLKMGDAFIEHLRGMFAIVVYDFNKKELKAWRDRIGMKPFYYSFHKETFIFSSEAKGILATRLIEKELNYTGLSYSMYLGTSPAPFTIYKNIHLLEAGSQLRFSLAEQTTETKPYWTLTYEASSACLSAVDLQNDMDELAKLHLTGDVEKALMLSGGLDSGTLAYFLAKHDKKLKALNIYCKQDAIDERVFAQANADNAAMPLSFLEVKSSINEETLEKYLLSEEEPNTTPEPAYFLSEKAKEQNIKVLYNALGPDELFGGYDYFAKASRLKKWQPLFPFLPGFMLPKAQQNKLAEWKEYGLWTYPLVSRQMFSWQSIVQFLGEKSTSEHPIAFIYEQIKKRYADFDKLPLLKKISYLDFHYYIGSHHTFRSDQPSMKHSIEMRFPFLDHIFIQKYFNQTTIFRGINKENKPFFRNLAQKILPEKVLNMPKAGFSMPLEKWLAALPEEKLLLNEPNVAELLHHNTNACAKWYWASLNRLNVQ